MYSLNQVKKLVSCGRDPARSLPLWRGFLLIPLILVCFAISPRAQAQACLDGCDSNFNTFQGQGALSTGGGLGNSAFGWRSLFVNTTGNFNTAIGPSLILNNADSNTAVGAAALLLNSSGAENTAVGVDAMVFNDTGVFNGAFGGFALFSNVDGFQNNAFGDHALFENITGASNTAIGDLALQNNDVSGAGTANFNTAVGAATMINNVNGSSNTVVGAGAGANLADGFNNTYVGQFVGDNNGTPIADEDFTIRIADLSSDGFGSAACFIGGIFNNPQPVGGNVVAVTLNLDTDQLGFDGTVGRPDSPAAAPHRNAPQPRMRPQAQHQAMLNNDKVEKLEVTVGQQQQQIARQQKQIDTLTGQLAKQAEQIQKVSAQLEMVRSAPRVVGNQ